jgi:DNA (cytosine-5)-methyltransferase 1
MADPRIIYSQHSLEAGLRLDADFIVIESVCRAWSPTGGRALYEEFARIAQQHGYAVTIFLTNAVLHGAPQLRQRFHFIAHKYEIRDLFTIAPLTYAGVPTVRDTIGDLEGRPDDEAWGHVRTVPEERELNVMRDLKQGESWGDAWRRVSARGLPAKPARFIAHRLIYDAPCGTILDIGAMVHPTQDRVLTLREGARLCCYPDGFQFARGKRGFHSSDVTQAVLPFVGRYLGAVLSLGMRRGLRVDGRDGIEVIDLRSWAKPFMPKKFIAKLSEFPSVGRPV